MPDDEDLNENGGSGEEGSGVDSIPGITASSTLNACFIKRFSFSVQFIRTIDYHSLPTSTTSTPSAATILQNLLILKINWSRL